MGRHRGAHPGRRSTVHRRLAEQQPAQSDLRLQRLRPAHGQRDRKRRRGRRRRWPLGAHGVDAPLPVGDGRPSLVAHPGGADPGRRCLWFSRRAPRTDRGRASILLWGGWFVVTAAVFSFGAGIIHPYYTVALAPAIAALIGTGIAMLWPQRHRCSGGWRWRPRWPPPPAGRCPPGAHSQWLPPLRIVILAVGLSAAAALASACIRAGRSLWSSARQELRSARRAGRLRAEHGRKPAHRRHTISRARERLWLRRRRGCRWPRLRRVQRRTGGRPTGTGGQPTGQPGQAPAGVQPNGTAGQQGDPGAGRPVPGAPSRLWHGGAAGGLLNASTPGRRS